MPASGPALPVVGRGGFTGRLNMFQVSLTEQSAVG